MAITAKPRGNVTNYYSDNKDAEYNKDNGKWLSLCIINDGISDLTFTVNNITLTVKPSESFDDNFEDFYNIRINTTSNYRLVLRG